MKTSKKQEGIALIVAILLSFMSLALIGSSLWLVVSSTQQSSMYKQYSNAKDAAVGGAEVIIYALYWKSSLNLPMGVYTINDQACFRAKRESPTYYWGSSCASTYPDDIINFGKINSDNDFYSVGIGITSTNITPPRSISGTAGQSYYAISVDAYNATRLDKSGLDFVYWIWQ